MNRSQANVSQFASRSTDEHDVNSVLPCQQSTQLPFHLPFQIVHHRANTAIRRAVGYWRLNGRVCVKCCVILQHHSTPQRSVDIDLESSSPSSLSPWPLPPARAPFRAQGEVEEFADTDDASCSVRACAVIQAASFSLSLSVSRTLPPSLPPSILSRRVHVHAHTRTHTHTLFS